MFFYLTTCFNIILPFPSSQVVSFVFACKILYEFMFHQGWNVSGPSVMFDATNYRKN